MRPLVLSTLSLLTCAAGVSAQEGKPAEALSPKPQIIRFSAIPDFNKGRLEETAKQLAAHLATATGIPVRYEASNDYAASVNGMVGNQLDFVWYGGLTSVQAEAATKGQVEFVACRDIDLRFKTYFIANKALVDSGKIKPFANLADLKASAGGFTFTFGDRSSTSGHIMPRHFLVQAGLDPEKSFKGPAAYQAKGGHASTMKAVMDGATDLGALNFAYYDQMKPEEKAQAPVVFTTPEYVDYCFLAHKRLGATTIARLREALVRLDPAKPADKAILDSWAAGRFTAADAKAWDGIRAVLKALPKDFLR
jgi:phosphonate transport system substrate-binding protein